MSAERRSWRDGLRGHYAARAGGFGRGKSMEVIHAPPGVKLDLPPTSGLTVILPAQPSPQEARAMAWLFRHLAARYDPAGATGARRGVRRRLKAKRRSLALGMARRLRTIATRIEVERKEGEKHG